MNNKNISEYAYMRVDLLKQATAILMSSGTYVDPAAVIATAKELEQFVYSLDKPETT